MISAVIITKNEEERIGQCLESLQGIADEIIVVDSLSTDKTEEICRSFGVHFEQREFEGYSPTKNYANSLAKYSYILSIDADEALSKELRASILAIKNQLDQDGYTFNRLTNYCGKWIYHCGWYPDTKLRLFRKDLGKWEGLIHETLELKGSKIQKLKGDLLHYSFPSISDQARKMNEFSDLTAQKLFEKGQRASLLKVILSPISEFFKKFILLRGFMDGFYGFVISVMSGYYRFYKYAKLREMWIKAKNTKH